MAPRTARLSAQILDEASTWFTELLGSDRDPAAQVEFIGWLRRSPEHVQAYLQIAALWEDADALQCRLADLEGLLSRARQESNVYPLLSHAPQTAPESNAQPVRGSHRWLWSIAASVAALLIVAEWLYLQRGIYTTDIGEQLSISLDDGSSVRLDARSRVRIRFTDERRDVELLAGQALFQVAKDTHRPFVVHSGNTHVRAVGTEFDIYRKRGDTIVTVVEGRVAVAGPATQSSSVLLQAGEQLTVPSLPTTSPTTLAPQSANIAAATAWTEKKLVFEGVALRDVVEEFNRFNRRQIVIRDPELNNFHVSGVFASTDSARMLDILRHRFNVKLHQSGDAIEIVRDRDDSQAGDAAQENFSH